MEKLSDYDYDLPADLIAQRPLPERSDTRLLHLDPRNGKIAHHRFSDLTKLLRRGDLLVLNDTRVTALRLFGTKPSGGRVELLLLKEDSPGVFTALAKPGKRLKPGARIEFEGGIGGTIDSELPEGAKRFRFDPRSNLSEDLMDLGRVPLPPYVRLELEDPERYQTVYARSAGSSAAPTAGLHFTPALLASLEAKGVRIAHVSLQVGLDTFRPVQTLELTAHVMHGESCELPEETAEAVNDSRGRIVAVGTTAVRTLESFATGVRRVEAGTMQTRLFIRPGYRLQVIDGMITNFHLPRTSMLMLVSALAGRQPLLSAYKEAIERRYRFLSFGDAMLVL